MLRKISLPMLAVSLFASPVLAEVNFDNGLGVNLKEELSNMEVPAPSAAQDKGIIWDWLFGKPAPKELPEWTIMVFGNGKNNLEQFILKDMNEMELVGSTSRLNIVVQAGRMAGFDGSDGDWKDTRRFLIKKDKDTARVASPVLQNLGKVDMGDYKSVIDFGKWAKARYPAKKYMLIMWNHGSGWEKSGKARLSKGISYDDETGNHINTPQLGLILKEIGGVDVYGSDACLMQMAEVDYELKDYAKFIVGSEETEPGDGYTYNDFLAPVAANPAMTPAQLAKVAVDAYSDHYKAKNEGFTQSYVKSAAIPRLLLASNAFVSAVMQAGEKDLVKKSRDAAMKYAMDDNKDLYDFTRLILAGTGNAAVKTRGQALLNVITLELVQHNRTNNSPGGMWSGPVDYSPSKGIAVYIPAYGGLGDGYLDLQWAKASNWDEFITWMSQDK